MINFLPFQRRLWMMLTLFLLTAWTVAAAEKVVAEWDFSKVPDASLDGKFKGTMRGETKVVNGLLTMKPGFEDKGEGLQMNKVYPELTPQEGFRLEIDFQPRVEQRTEEFQQMLWDNKYLLAGNYANAQGNHAGFGISLYHNGGGVFTPRVWMGIADATKTFSGKQVTLALGEMHSVHLAYNGASRVDITINGALNSSFSFTEGGPLEPAIRPTVIGDRVGSTHNRFDGAIARVKLVTYPPEWLTVTLAGRAAFVRGEADAAMNFQVANLGKEGLQKATLDVTFPGQDQDLFPPTRQLIDSLPGKSSRQIKLPVETKLRPGTYPCEIVLTGLQGEKQVSTSSSFSLIIGPQLPPDAMPVLMWGGGDRKLIQEHGFTHDLGGFGARIMRSTNETDTILAIQRELDDYVADGFRRGDYFTLAHDKKLIEQFPRKRRDGSIVPRNAEASNPEYQAILREVAEKTAKALQGHPGCDALLINSEVRDSTGPSFGDVEPAAFEKFAGFPIPEEVLLKSGPNYSRIADFPFDRVVDPDHRLLTFYRWFWKQGDGWNPVQSLVNDTYHKHISRPFWTFFDPAVRVPPVWGSGGNVDYLSHWTYAYPDPIRVGAVTDELRAMADGLPGQEIMSMTQIICYRSATAPQDKNPDPTPAWALEQPEAKFISIPPDSLRASIWSKIARRVQGIMFHGYGSVWGKPCQGSYCTTNPETAVMLKKVLDEVITPLGPTLKVIPEREPEVAILHSFASNVFAGRGTWGWVTWLLDAHLMLQWANLSPAVIYEEKILRDGLDDLKVLCLFHCDVLTKPVYDAIKAFQERGGIVVADEFLVPGILPDILLKSCRRSVEAEEGKAALQELAAELRQQLDQHFRAYTDASNLDLITRVRSYENSDYLFILNDRRVYGDYLGPWKLTMEKGMPNQGTVTVRRDDVKAVYDLLAHKAVPFTSKNGVTSIKVDFDSNDGQLLLLLDHPLPKLQAELTADQKVNITMANRRGQVSKALYPIHIEVLDPNGKVMDGSGHACAIDGKYQYQLEMAKNDLPGKWKVRVTELAGNQKVEMNFTVR